MKYLLFATVLFFVSCTKLETLKPASNQNSEAKKLATTSKPNVILILSDDVGYECLTVDNGGSYQTPNLDAWANQNTRYTECHACPTCSPSRVELMSGKYNFRNYTAWGIMNPTIKTFGNLFHDNGYTTGFFGKGQLDGGVTSTLAFGFDKCVMFAPYAVRELESHYKNPDIYVDGTYLPDSVTANKYGDDFFTDSLISFMGNANAHGKPFLAYYPMALGHAPYQPTPDDSDFLSFDETHNHSDPKYFPSMMKYMDKKVQQIIHAVDSLGIANNTIIIFTGDNGTPSEMTSLYNGQLIQGGKALTIEYGTHVPLIAQWKGHLFPNIDSSLIDFSDFLPTLADMAGLTIPSNFGIIDGKSFYSGTPRDWIFCSYWKDPQLGDSSKISWWVQDRSHKVYDSLFVTPAYKKNSMFLFLVKPLEPKNGIIKNAQNNLLDIENNFKDILKSYHQ